MQQTLRKTFSIQNHQHAKPLLRSIFYPEMTLETLLLELQSYLDKLHTELLQPRQQVIDRILREAALY